MLSVVSSNLPSRSPLGLHEYGASAPLTMPPRHVSAVSASQLDDAAQDLLAQVRRLVLPNVLWCEVAKYAPLSALLRLRTAGKGMSAWVDRSVQIMSAHANKVPAMLTALRASANFRHVHTVHIRESNAGNLPAAIAAIANMPHGHLHLKISTDVTYDSLRLVWPLLRTIFPASLAINADASSRHTLLTSTESEAFMSLRYPLSLGTGIYSEDDEQDVQALSAIPMLQRLDLSLDGFSDALASAFQGHRKMTALRIEDFMDSDLIMSTDALAMLARNTTLKDLHVGNTRDVFGPEALQALAENRTLEHLRVGSYLAPFNAKAALALSKSTTLRSLDIALSRGVGHLAKIPSLTDLTLCSVHTRFTKEDAQHFAKHAHLHALHFSREVRSQSSGRDGYAGRWQFENGALEILARTDVAHLVIPATEWSDAELDTLLANRALRSLDCGIVYRTGEQPPGDMIRVAIKLAGHPTLETLRITFVYPWDATGSHAYARMTAREEHALYQAWGRDRVRSALHVNDYREREHFTQCYRMERLDQQV